MLTDDQKEMIDILQNAIWKLEEVLDLRSNTSESKTEEEIDELFRGSILEIIAKLEIGISVTYESYL